MMIISMTTDTTTMMLMMLEGIAAEVALAHENESSSLLIASEPVPGAVCISSELVVISLSIASARAA